MTCLVITKFLGFFMGKQWDSDKGGRDQWIAWLTEVMREGFEFIGMEMDSVSFKTAQERLEAI
jgi:hypothetical protein